MAKPRLRAELTMDDTQFHAALRRAHVGAQKFSASLTAKLGPAVAGGLAATGTILAGVFSYQTFKEGIRGAIDAGERLNDLKAITGASIASLSKLSDVFEAAGVPSDMLETSISRMQKTIFAAQKDTKTFAPLLGKLKINFDDFNALSPDQQFLKLGKAINSLEDPTERAGVAIAIFGRSGAKLLETFQDFDGIDFRNLDRRAAFFARNSAQFDKFNSSMRKAKMASQEFFLVLAERMLPTLQKTAEAISNVNFGGLVDKIKAALGQTVSFPKTVAKALGDPSGALAAAGSFIGNNFMGGVKTKRLPGQGLPNNMNNGARSSVSMIPSSTGGIDAFKARGVNATLPELLPRRLGGLTEPTTRGDNATGLNGAKAPIGLDSVFLGPSKSAGGVRRRGESKEEFRARMDAAKRGEKTAVQKQESLETLVQRIADLLEGK